MLYAIILAVIISIDKIRRTFQETLVLGKFRSIIQLPKILRPLRKVFPLNECIALLRDNIRRCAV